VGQAKLLLDGFWQMMVTLKQWHQDHSAPAQGAFTLSGRYRYSYRSSHAERMAHRVMGSLSGLVKEAAIEIHQLLTPRDGKPYLILDGYLLWDVPTENQQELLELAMVAMRGRCRNLLPDVVKDWQASVLAPVPVRDMLL
jgi:hypothetical protein